MNAISHQPRLGLVAEILGARRMKTTQQGER
jgi:hypothetical protein